MKRRSFSKILCTFLAGTLTLSVGMIGVDAAQIDDSFVSAETASPATGDGLPRAYSSRDLGFVTSVKSQYGQSCWAYASMATLESMLLRLGYNVADMSTDHLNLWATTRSDGTGWQRDIGSDGYPNIALGYLSSWQGGVLQSDAGDVSLNGSYTGLYMTQGNFVTIQFMDGNDKITLEYTYQVSHNTLALTDKNNETTLFVRAGTGSSTYATAEDLRGKWRDSTGTSGYNFKEGGIVELTLVNFTVPVINMPINGTYNGTYQVDGDKLTIRYSVFGKSITDVYRFSVEGGTLTLTNEENGKVSSYMR